MYVYVKVVNPKEKENQMFIGRNVVYKKLKASSKEDIDRMVYEKLKAPSKEKEDRPVSSYTLLFEIPGGEFSYLYIVIQTPFRKGGLQGESDMLHLIAPESSVYILNASGQNIDSLHC